MAGEKFIALEETSQEIKTAVEGVKTDVAGVNTDVDAVQGSVSGVDADVTSIKNTIGTPASGETVVSLLDDIKGSSGGNKKKFVSSTTNVLLSETINFTVEEDSTQILQKSGKTLALRIPVSGEIALKIVSDAGSYESLSVKVINPNSGATLGYVGVNRSSPTNIGYIYVKEGDSLIFVATATGGRIDVETIQILGEIVNINNDIAFETLNGDYSSL